MKYHIRYIEYIKSDSGDYKIKQFHHYHLECENNEHAKKRAREIWEKHKGVFQLEIFLDMKQILSYNNIPKLKREFNSRPLGKKF